LLLQTHATLPARFVRHDDWPLPLDILHGKPKLFVTGNVAQSVIRGLNRNWISAAISILILVIAASVLYRLLRDIEPARVIAALQAQSPRKVLIGGAFTVAAYGALIFYDVFALRTISRHAVPFRVAAFASFTSFTIGHSLGAATLTGGLVRLRVYGVWGLSVRDVVKIAFITGMTFCLGSAFVLGSALCYAPDAAGVFDHLPPWINRLAGLTALLAIACYLIWLAPRRRAVGRSDWRIVLPSARFTILQIAIGATDLSLVALAMYALLPSSPAISFATVLVIFLIATLLGTISHVPGSLGVIEAAILIGLPQFHKDELLAALLTFRVIYFVIPLAIAAIGLGLQELLLLGRPVTVSGDDSVPSL
jgi:uncharacterized membrane protein YbhN (UPF0104 family)